LIARPMKRFSKVAVSIIASASCLFVAELGLRLFAPVPDPFDEFKRGQHSNQYIRSEFPPHFSFRTEPEQGLPGVYGHNLFTTDNMGFRGDDLVTPKPKHEFRIFMVGGSTTECLYLDDAKAISGVLQKRLGGRASGDINVKVYGAGKSGDASDDHVSMIAHRIVHLEPDMIIVFSGINDLTRSIYHYDYTHYVKEKTGTEPSLLLPLATGFQMARRVYNLKTRFFPTDAEVSEKITSQTRYREKVRMRESVPVSDERPRLDLQAYANNLRTIMGSSQAHKVRLIFMTQQTTWNSPVDPAAKSWQWMRYRNGVNYREDYMNDAMESLNDQMRRIAAENSILLYDLARSMPKSLEFFYDDAHFNEKGADTAATELAALILEQHLIR
jgi:lysophospholipase L1-like esterase